MQIKLGFGKTPQMVEIPDQQLLGVLTPNEVPIQAKGETVVREALKHPIGTAKLSEMVKAGERIAIITSDITRPLPSKMILPAVLEELWQAGVRPEDVVIVFALGSHRPHTETEMQTLVGEDIYQQIRCVDSDPHDFVHLGTTAAGTPVEITRIVATADRRIGLGNIEYHYFAGYSGGAKAIMPGVSTRAAIQSNHSRMVLPHAAAGQLEGNPVRMDLEEATSFCPLDFMVNVVLDEQKQIIHAVAGHYITAHRAGCRFLDQLYLTPISTRADVVIVSQGGAPKDLNLYQTQKALDNAKHAVKPGGVIILVGRCEEGLGEEVFEDWMKSAPTPESLVERIQADFQLGGHKAAAISLVLEQSDIYLVSALDPDLVRSIFLQPYETVQQAFDAALQQQGKDATVWVMPYGGSTLPMVDPQSG